MLGLRYALGLGRVCDMQDEKRSTLAVRMPRVCKKEFAPITGSVGKVPKATMTALSCPRVLFLMAFDSGINSRH
ncbi:hypothetical protein ACE6H2_001000 [Prunus campanulata]